MYKKIPAYDQSALLTNDNLSARRTRSFSWLAKHRVWFVQIWSFCPLSSKTNSALEKDGEDHESNNQSCTIYIEIIRKTPPSRLDIMKQLIPSVMSAPSAMS